ncbi:MAG: Rieske (2Fe-2S) protein [Solirubrobacteraceae bacterium]
MAMKSTESSTVEVRTLPFTSVGGSRPGTNASTRGDGTVEGDQIVCACHGSRFDRRDGSVQRGPATAPQPAFQVRVSDGRLEVRRLSPG